MDILNGTLCSDSCLQSCGPLSLADGRDLAGMDPRIWFATRHIIVGLFCVRADDSQRLEMQMLLYSHFVYCYHSFPRPYKLAFSLQWQLTFCKGPLDSLQRKPYANKDSLFM